jgi:hypothetical protein
MNWGARDSMFGNYFLSLPTKSKDWMGQKNKNEAKHLKTHNLGATIVTCSTTTMVFGVYLL